MQTATEPRLHVSVSADRRSRISPVGATLTPVISLGWSVPYGALDHAVAPRNGCVKPAWRAAVGSPRTESVPGQARRATNASSDRSQAVNLQLLLLLIDWS